MNQIKRAVNFLGVSRLVVIGFLLVLMVSVFPLGINPGMIYSDCLVRIGMNGFLVLAMMVSIVCGAGLNFGLPIGILCGLLGGSIAVQFNWSGLAGFWGACIVSVPFALIAGYFYAALLNNVKGSDVHCLAGASVQQSQDCVAHHRRGTAYNHDTGRKL